MKTRKNRTENQFSEFSRAQRNICLWALTCGLVSALLFMAFREESIGKGLLLGTCFSIVNFLLMGISVSMVIGQSRPKASLFGLASILTRYAILAVPMIVAVRSVSFNFIAVVVGIFTVQIVTLFNYIVIRPILDGE